MSELAAGRTKYGASGSVGGGLNPKTAVWLVCGFSTAGKSYLVQSIPDAIVLNFDGNEVVYQEDGVPTVRGVMNPLRDGEGNLLNSQGEVIPHDKLDYDYFDRIRQQLLKDAKAGQRPFNYVVIDTLKTAYEMLCGDPSKPFQQSKDGRRGYEETNRIVDDFVASLSYAGYGVILLTHLKYRKTKDKEGNTVEDPKNYDLALAPSLWARLQNRRTAFLMLDRLAKPQAAGKAPVMQTKAYTSRINMHETFNGRFDVQPVIELPTYRPWDAVEAAYSKEQ